MSEDDLILEKLEHVFKNLLEIKKYVKDQRDIMTDKYPDQHHGILVLNYLHNRMLNFVKDDV